MTEIQSITFASDVVEISFFETEENQGPIQEARTILIPVHVLPEALEELRDAALHVVDEAQVVKRSPPDRLVRRR